MRAYRARRKEAAPDCVNPTVNPVPDDPGEQVRLLAAWAKECLIVPPGHPAAGEPLALPSYAEVFLADALSHPESLLCIGRKNAKSAICAVLA